MSEAKISKIVLEMPGLPAPLELTLDQAKALKILLEGLFPEPLTSPTLPPIIIDRPIYIPAPNQPWISPWKQWEITCQTPGTAHASLQP